MHVLFLQYATIVSIQMCSPEGFSRVLLIAGLAIKHQYEKSDTNKAQGFEMSNYALQSQLEKGAGAELGFGWLNAGLPSTALLGEISSDTSK